jgi:hypothetical protein
MVKTKQAVLADGKDQTGCFGSLINGLANLYSGLSSLINGLRTVTY